MRTISILVVVAATLGFSSLASAQFAKPEDAIKYRKNALFVMQQHYARVGAMAAGRVPFDAKVAADNAAIAESMSRLPWAAFGEGTDKGDTKAKPEIWMEQAKFKAAAEKMQGEMSKLAAAAKTGNLDSVKAAFQATSGTCKACHDDFRQ
ncbi:MAG: cytochrome c [Hylemonella sp.]|uniref:c-type cytochrome n=1 Tax=Hylemonella sp. TaxID=2066020 RepID=UPI0022C780DC|nr:cytochrome c [Hylemonella sp.]MCZ8253390.1 cytochrome c [Hylemonella sp.]